MQVVYVLVEIRKYLEQRSDLRNRYPALFFYCCWAVHSQATGNGGDRILERFDQLYPLTGSGLSREQIGEIFRTLTLRKLKEDLVDFLDVIGVDCSLKTSPSDWLQFLRAYACITEDCPFVLSTNSTVQLANIDSIVVQTVPLPEGTPPETIFSTNWIVKKGDKILGEYGTTFTDYSVVPPAATHSTSIVSSDSNGGERL